MDNITSEELALWHPLHRAAYTGNLEEVRSSIENGVDINSRNLNSPRYRSYTALHCSSWIGHLAITQYLLSNNADPDIQNDRGFTALNTSIWNRHEDVAILLLEYNPDVNLPSGDGYTPLMSACLRCSYTLVKLLLQNGADPNIVAHRIVGTHDYEWSALHAAVEHKNLLVLAAVIKYGADLNRLAEGALQNAEMRQNEQHVEFLRLMLEPVPMI